MSMWTEREINWVLENRWKQLSRQTSPNNFEVDWIGVQREIENGLTRRMRRELQVEPLILCLAQPAPSGTRAYKPQIVNDQNQQSKNKHYPNVNNSKNNRNQNYYKNNPSSKPINQLNNNQSVKPSDSTPVTSTEDVQSGRTRRRRSTVSS